MPCAYIQTKEKVYGPIFGAGRDYIQGHVFGKKITSICNLLSLLTYLYTVTSVFGMLIGLHIWDVYLGELINSILRYSLPKKFL